MWLNYSMKFLKLSLRPFIFIIGRVFKMKPKTIRESEQSYDSCQIKNLLIDYYLNSFNKRQHNCENKLTICCNYLTLFCYIICIVKYFLAFIIEFDFETNLLIFEMSVLLGGIEKYNRMLLMLSCLLGVCFNIYLRLANRHHVTEWTQVFAITRSNVRQLPHFVNDFNTLNKLTRAIKLVYRFISLSFILVRKFSLLSVFYEIT